MEPRGSVGEAAALEDEAVGGGFEIFCCRLNGDEEGEFCSWRDFALVMTGTCCWRGVVELLAVVG